MSSREDAYDAYVFPLMAQVIAVCKEHDIPVLATFQIDDDDPSDPRFCTTAIIPAGRATGPDAMRDALACVRKPSPLIAMTITSEPRG